MQDKAFSLFSTKSLNTEESGDFIVEGIASTPTLDSDNDSLNSLGASFRTLPFPFILNHDHLNPVGQVTEATPTNKGIKVKIRIPYVKEIGKLKEQTDYAIHCIKYNIISGLSIGFSANQSDAVVNEKGGLNIDKFEVYELSLTPLQSNTTAFITAFKSLKQDKQKEVTVVDNDNSNEEVIDSVEDTAIEVVSEEVNVGDSTEANTQDEITIPIDVDQTEEVVDSASDIVEVKKSKSVSLSIKTNKTQYKKVSLK